MSRSRKHAPVGGWAKCRSDRYFKLIWHRGLRSHNRQMVRMGREPLHQREYVRANIYRSQKDGKQVFGPWAASNAPRWLEVQRDPAWYAALYTKWMRK